MSRTFVFGDIHGAFIALTELIETIQVKPEDRLIFLGDYVDGWSQSYEVVQYLMELDKKYSCIFIKGNHDVWCENWLRQGTIDELWYHSGGKASIESYSNRTDQDLKQHISFFERMENYHVDEENRLFVHAGFSAVRGPQHERYASNFTWDRTLWETAISLDDRIPKDSPRYPKRLKLFKEIYIGHTPTLYIGKYEPANAANLWNMDTGAAFDGKLSVMDIDTKEFWQSYQVMELYPNEKGRN
ncbi:metallophosphoesterase family protein [Ferruginibacter sp. HRS2-29]|uniref:metallophosphoesterase family protein n=1 Tax=Ferruginibacter sp. HRS2-29 TaxID=2487334 RepID=UPI0020CDF387|nr:metallophosphoesterase family protein [Ferruginibacter sp. HRS2-29]MCP9750124.1 serine/threonine protein phosphatase [Ferruginibacter sp. HRS2-29]